MKNKKVTIEDLAGMVQVGFQSVDERFNKIEKRFDKIDGALAINADEHEAIKLRLDNVAYRFELVELQKRVEILEKI